MKTDPEHFARMVKKIEEFFDRDKFVSFYSSIPQFILQVGIVLNTGNFSKFGVVDHPILLPFLKYFHLWI